MHEYDRDGRSMHWVAFCEGRYSLPGRMDGRTDGSSELLQLVFCLRSDRSGMWDLYPVSSIFGKRYDGNLMMIGIEPVHSRKCCLFRI